MFRPRAVVVPAVAAVPDCIGSVLHVVRCLKLFVSLLVVADKNGSELTATTRLVPEV